MFNFSVYSFNRAGLRARRLHLLPGFLPSEFGQARRCSFHLHSGYHLQLLVLPPRQCFDSGPLWTSLVLWLLGQAILATLFLWSSKAFQARAALGRVLQALVPRHRRLQWLSCHLRPLLRSEVHHFVFCALLRPFYQIILLPFYYFPGWSGRSQISLRGRTSPRAQCCFVFHGNAGWFSPWGFPRNLSYLL